MTLPKGVQAKLNKPCTPSQIKQCTAHFEQALEKQFDKSRDANHAEAAKFVAILEGKLAEMKQQFDKDLKLRRAEVNERLTQAEESIREVRRDVDELKGKL
jgi:hypothetical protein